MPSMTTRASDRPSQRGETWNDTEAINRHRAMTPSQRVALAIEVSRAALMFANARVATATVRESPTPPQGSKVGRWQLAQLQGAGRRVPLDPLQALVRTLVHIPCGYVPFRVPCGCNGPEIACSDVDSGRVKPRYAAIPGHAMSPLGDAIEGLPPAVAHAQEPPDASSRSQRGCSAVVERRARRPGRRSRMARCRLPPLF